MSDEEPEAWSASVGDDRTSDPDPSSDEHDAAPDEHDTEAEPEATPSGLPMRAAGDHVDDEAAWASPGPADASSVWDLDPDDRGAAVWGFDPDAVEAGSVWDSASSRPSDASSDAGAGAGASAWSAGAADAPDEPVADVPPPDDPDDSDDVFRLVIGTDDDDADDAAKTTPGARLLVDDRDEPERFRVEVDDDALDTLDDLLRESAAADVIARAGAPTPDAAEHDADDEEPRSLADRSGDSLGRDGSAEDGGPGGGSVGVDGWGEDDDVWSFTVDEPDDSGDLPLASTARPDRDTGWSDASNPVTSWPGEQGLREAAAAATAGETLESLWDDAVASATPLDTGDDAVSDAGGATDDVVTPPGPAFDRIDDHGPVGAHEVETEPASPFAPPPAEAALGGTGALGLPATADASTPAGVTTGAAPAADTTGAAPAADDATEVHALLGDLFGDEDVVATAAPPAPAPPRDPDEGGYGEHDAEPTPAASPPPEPEPPPITPGAISFSATSGRKKRRRGRR